MAFQGLTALKTGMTTTKTKSFRSGLERRAAEALEGLGRHFTYEEEVIKYVKPERYSKYTPDFVVYKTDGSKMYIEMKGRFDTADRQKHLLIKQQHPDKDIRIVFQNANTKISKTSKTTYAKWATDKGFKWADKGVIPQEWLDE